MAVMVASGRRRQKLTTFLGEDMSMVCPGINWHNYIHKLCLENNRRFKVDGNSRWLHLVHKKT